MRVIRTFAILGATLALVACGSQDKQEDANDAPQLTNQEKAELEEEYASVPAAAIVRVPVDAQGNPTGAPEMRVVENGDAPNTDAEMTSAWEGGNQPASIVASASELDADSSTDSWHGWGYGNCRYSSHSRCGYSSYGHGYFYNSYRPRLYRRGYRFNYNRGYHCRLGAYRYYSYRSYRYW